MTFTANAWFRVRRKPSRHATGRELGHEGGVVHEDVDTAELFDGALHHRIDRFVVGDVDSDRDRFSIERVGDFLGTGLVDVSADDGRTRFRERGCIRLADAAGGSAGDDRHLAMQ